MCPLMAFFSNDANRETCWMEQLDQELKPDFVESEMNGWGLGYYTGHQALSYKRPHVTQAWKFGQQLEGLDAKVALWHLAPSTAKSQHNIDAQPLHYQSWLFCCETLPPLNKAAQTEYATRLPDHFTRRLESNSMAEQIFYWVLHDFQQQGWLDSPPQQLKTLAAQAQRSLNNFAELFMANPQLQDFSGVLTNGRVMLVFSRKQDMYISFKEGLKSCPRCGDELKSSYSLRESHNLSRAIFIIKGLQPHNDENKSWQTVGENTIIGIDRDLNSHYFKWTAGS